MLGTRVNSNPLDLLLDVGVWAAHAGIMIRKGFQMSVRPDCHEEYERRHSPIWPELESMLKEHGVSNYSIFLNPETSQLFGYAEIEDEESWNSIASTEVYQRWWSVMKEIMPFNPDSGSVSQELRQVFHLP